VQAGEDLARPVGIAQLVHGEQVDVAAEARELAQKRLAFLVGADAEERAVVHA
jgi:hypothetical protein